MTLNKNIIFKVLLFLTAIFIIFNPPVDPDFGWHYKYGEYIVNNKSLLNKNIFSYNMQSYDWVNSYWVSQVLIFLTYNKLGNVLGIIFLSSLLYLVFFKIVLKESSKSFQILSTVLFSMYASSYILTARPMLFSTAFFLVLFNILLENKRHIKYLPLLFLLWVNMHADFVLGISVFFIFLISDFKKNKIHTASFVLSSLATLINPYFINLHLTMLKELTGSGMIHIAEMLPLNFLKYQIGSMVHIFIFGSILGIHIYLKKETPKWYFFALIFFFALSFKALYFYRVFLLLSFFNLKKFSKLLQNQNIKFKNVQGAFKIFSPVAFLILAFIFSKNVYETIYLDVAYKNKGFPVEAVEYLTKEQPNGNIFNNYDWGGYLILYLPNYKTFIDGRMPSWKDNKNHSVFDDYLLMTRHPKDNVELINKYINENNITVILEKSDSKLAKYVKEQLHWTEVISNENTILLLK